jgi:hypothetical protein
MKPEVLDSAFLATLTVSQRAMRAAAAVSNGLSHPAALRLYDIKRSALGDARYVIRHATPDMITAVASGSISTATARRLMASVKQEAQVEALETLKRNEAGNVMRGQLPPLKKLVRRGSKTADGQIVRLIESMSVCANVLPSLLENGELATHEKCADWIKELRQIRRNLTRAVLDLQHQQSTKNGDQSHGQ